MGPQISHGHSRMSMQRLLEQHKQNEKSEKTSAEVGVEPGKGAFDYVAAVLGIGKHVAFVFVDYELGFDAERFEGVPELVGLRGGNFAVAVADQN